MTVKILDERIPPKDVDFPIKCKNHRKELEILKKDANNQNVRTLSKGLKL